MLAVALGVSGAAEAGFENGSFENPTSITPGSYVTYGAGYATAPGEFAWEVQDGSIDLISRPDFWNANPPGAGEQYVDLAGFTSGTISQDFDTVAGQTYNVSFIYTNNNSAISPGPIMAVGVDNGLYSGLADLAYQTYQAIVPGANQNPGYVTITNYTFTALSGTSTLWFESLLAAGNNPSYPDAFGVFLDAVSVTALPEPTSMAIAGLGIAGFAGARLRRRRQAA